MPATLADEPYAGRLADGAHRFAVRVYHEDTDAGGIVYHASYLRFMERGRTDLLALAGVDLGRALADGAGGYVVTSLAIDYRRPARLGEALLVASRLVAVRAAACVIQQTVSRDREEIATATVTVAFVGADGRPRRQPAAWRAAFRAIGEGQG